MKSVLLALSDNAFAAQVAQTLSRSKRYRVAGISDNGVDAMAMIPLHRPDVLIVDLYLQKVDGLVVLQAAKELKRPPCCLVLAKEMNPKLSDALLQMEIEDVLLQPCRIQSLLNRLRTLEQEHEMSAREMEISETLQKLKIGAHYAGYRYLCAAILYAMQDMHYVDAVTKLLYPVIAQECDSTAVQVERAIRTAIEKAWKCGGGEAMREMFDYVPAKKRPTNTEFIALIAECLSIKMKTNIQ